MYSGGTRESRMSYKLLHFFTSFISLNVPHRVDSRALLPLSVYAEPKIGNNSFLPILPLFFYPTVLCRVLRARQCGRPKTIAFA